MKRKEMRTTVRSLSAIGCSLVLLFLSVALSVSCKQEKTAGANSDDEAGVMRYVKIIRSAERTVEFTYDEQQLLTAAVDRRGDMETHYDYSRKGNSIQVDWDSYGKLTLVLENETTLKCTVNEGNMTTEDLYVLDTQRRVQRMSTGADANVEVCVWQDGNLMSVTGETTGQTYTYGKVLNRPVNVDIINCISDFTLYPWYACSFAWGQSRCLPESISGELGTARYDYELDENGYVVKVTETMNIDFEEVAEEIETVYTIEYCD